MQRGRALARWLVAGIVVVACLAGTTMRAGAKEGMVSGQALAVDSWHSRVFVATDRLRIFDATSGRLLQTASLGSEADAVALDARADRAFVLTGAREFYGPGYQSDAQGRVRVLDAATGRLVRIVSVDQRPLAMAVDATTGRVFVFANSAVGSGYAATVTVLDTTTGQPLRRVVVGNNPDAMGVDEQRGRVVVAGDYRTCLLDARDGTIMRCVTVGNHPRIVLVDARAGHAYLVNSDDSIDVVGSGTGATVRSIGLSTCGALMAVALDQGTGRLVVTGGIGQGAAFSGHIQVVDAGSGRVLRSIGIGRPPLVGVTSNGTNRAVILTASYGSDGRNSGDVRLLDMAAGSIRRTATLPAMPLAAALDQRHGHLFVLQADGRLRMLDARRGTILDSR